MRAVLQRVSEASVTVDHRCVARIGRGVLVLGAVAPEDTEGDRLWLARKIAALRIFDDSSGVMNLSLLDVGGDVLAVSQFTLFASTRKGNRPSWSAAAPPEVAAPAFAAFVRSLETVVGRAVHTGVFGADMQVALVNEGPVTIVLDTRDKE